MSETPAVFTEQDHAVRMDRAAREAAVVGLAGLLATPGPDLMWLCGYRPAAATEHLTLLVLTADSEPRLLVPASERPDAEEAPGAVRISAWKDGQDPYAAAAGLLRPHGRYGVSDSTWALHLLGLQEALPLTTYRPLSTALPLLRVIKDEHEVARLAAAGAAADATYDDILSVRFAGRRETDVAADLDRLLREHGHSRVDFTVVGSGPDGADPHHRTGERAIAVGDMVVLAFGGLQDGYGSRTARTAHVGEPTAEERRVHEVVQDAQQAAFEAMRPDVPCRDIGRAARAVITDAGYGDRADPRTGHGIGVTTHEPPDLTEAEDLPLLPGMCFAVGAGIHLPGRFGVRVEDVVTCTETGGRRLNRAPREMAIVT
ncbi:M24 family metallopeptidase [Streptomyces sp. YU58]|uniref:M24 family metallopeptidase n=1 Tax=Streptomyces sp. SX92 TaxID=3158972 RepID=UPI0027BB0AA9|nr:M24 family metallopeptidase [Streptomyces coralus]WLW53564.1 M24 family metallopeptidase [Streptomyces coralus]